MIRMTAVSLICMFSSACFAAQTACPPSAPTNSTGFCATFKQSAECYCTSSGLPRGMCGDMNKLYNRMVGMFGTLQRACEFQHNTSTQACIDDWNCYRSGGNNSQNEPCSSTGNACE